MARVDKPAGSTGLVSIISAAWRVWRMLVLGAAAPAAAAALRVGADMVDGWWLMIDTGRTGRMENKMVGLVTSSWH
jgi:hypothetical protein